MYTRAWTRRDGRHLPARVVDDGMGVLTIRSAQPEDAGVYVCTGSDFSYQMDTDFATLIVRGRVMVLLQSTVRADIVKNRGGEKNQQAYFFVTPFTQS